MSIRRLLVASVCVAVIITLLGCSSGTTPVAPTTAGSLDRTPIIGLTQTGDYFNAVGLMGVYEVSIDLETMTADLVSKRQLTIGEDFIVSGIGFFTMAPCSHCLTLIGVTLDGNMDANLTFKIDHPFPEGDTGLPPAANRLDLNVFDLAAVIAPTVVTATNYPLTAAAAFTGYCVDADGYTTELSNVLDAPAGALPYFLVVDDTVGGTSTFNKFAMGTSAEFTAVFAHNAPALVFDMYLTMGYGASAKKLQRLTPKYYNPEFNRKPAWKIVVTGPEGANPPTMGNTWQDNDSTTPFNVQVAVYDWQQGVAATADPLTYADEADTSLVYAVSNVESVSIEIPGMNNTLQTATTAASGSGDFDDPLLYDFGIPNQNLLPAGEYLGLVKVLDERVPLTPLDGRDFLIESPDGIALDHYAIDEYAAYQQFVATVVVGCGPITGSVISPACPVTGVGHGGNVSFNVSATSGNGGNPIVLYQVDIDYDGVAFTTDDSNTTGLFSAGPFDNPNCPADPVTPVTYTVAFRATDSCTPPNVTVFATCDVTVDNCVNLFKETFDTAPADWTYNLWEDGYCGHTAWTGFRTVGPFGPSGSGAVRYPDTGTYTDGGMVATVVTPPFDVPTGSSEVNLRVYFACGWAGSWQNWTGLNWKIANSTTPGLSPFSGNGAIGGTTILSTTSAHGSTMTPINTCGAYCQGMDYQQGWGSTTMPYGGGAFPASLTMYVDLIIPASFYGNTVKVALQWCPDICGYVGSPAGFATDDWEVIVY